MIRRKFNHLVQPQQALAINPRLAAETGTFFVGFMGGTAVVNGVPSRHAVMSNPGLPDVSATGRVSRFDGTQASRLALPGVLPNVGGDGWKGFIIAARVRATGAQPGSPGQAFGLSVGTSQAGFGVGFSQDGLQVGCTYMSTNGAFVAANSPAVIGEWYTVYVQLAGNGNGPSRAYINGKPAVNLQNSLTSGGLPAPPSQVALGAMHRSEGYLRNFNGDVEWAAAMWLDSATAFSLDDARAAAMYEAGYPYNLFAPPERDIWVPQAVDPGSVTFFRPASDVSTTGWTSTEASLAAALNEATPNDASYITSPDIASAPEPATFDLDVPMPAGSYTARFRARRTLTAGEARLVLLDAGSGVVGSTSWQVLASAPALYEQVVTLSGTATKFQIEVRA